MHMRGGAGRSVEGGVRGGVRRVRNRVLEGWRDG